MIWEVSITKYIAMGGWVMVPLILLSFVLAFLIIERLMFFSGIAKNDITPDELVTALGQADYRATAGGTGICRMMLEEFLSARQTYHRLDKAIVDEVCMRIVPRFKTHMKNIGALTAAAPLLGLLGTVSGMVTTFNVMNIFGTGNAKAMSGGISEAMITTQYGLVVAIIGLYVSMILTRRARKYETLVEEVSVHIIRKFKL